MQSLKVKVHFISVLYKNNGKEIIHVGWYLGYSFGLTTPYIKLSVNSENNNNSMRIGKVLLLERLVLGPRVRFTVGGVGLQHSCKDEIG